jgi:hypothetical protein
MRTQARFSFGSLGFALPFLSACAPTSEEVGARWNAFVEARSGCTNVSDCVLVYPGCPLGCASAVSAEHEAEAKAYAEELVSAYQAGGSGCVYDCAAFALACTAGQCEAVGQF